ncbi:hypothetical protein [Streptomyces sp. NPDC058595]|uniref:hypothetical protein n=1 Tax=Streptomyces sp. NPDC058595 TaxID=3346550 RepID=UPI0036563FAD
MIDVLTVIYGAHGVTVEARHAGSERRDGAVWQMFEVRAVKGPDSLGRGAIFRLPVSDDVAAGILRPDDHPHYPVTGDELLTWKLWTTVLGDAEEQAKKAAEDREGYWPYAQHLFGADGLDRLLALYRRAEVADVEAGIPVRARYVHEAGHRLTNTGRSHGNRRGGAFLFRCVDCKRLARLADFREGECWIPLLLDLEHQEDHRQLSFGFVHRVNESGSSSFAIWHRGTTRVVLYAAEGAKLGTLDVPEGVAFDDLLALVIERWGPLSTVQYSTGRYGAED